MEINKNIVVTTNSQDLLAIEKDKTKLKKLADEVDAIVNRKSYKKTPNEIYKEIEEIVNNVLYGEPSSEDIINTNELYGKKVSYVLAIPKGDTHSWENKKVKFNNEIYMTIGKATEGIEDMIPLCWNKKVKVEKYDG